MRKLNVNFKVLIYGTKSQLAREGYDDFFISCHPGNFMILKEGSPKFGVEYVLYFRDSDFENIPKDIRDNMKYIPEDSFHTEHSVGYNYYYQGLLAKQYICGYFSN